MTEITSVLLLQATEQAVPHNHPPECKVNTTARKDDLLATNPPWHFAGVTINLDP